MKLFLIRHAQSANNLLGEQVHFDEYMNQRDPEPPLTDLGFRQAELLAEHLVSRHYTEDKLEAAAGDSYGFTKLYCSPMLRTMQTVWPFVQRTGLMPEIWLDIHEQGGIFRGNPHGEGGAQGFPGLTRAEMGEQFPGYLLGDDCAEIGWWTGGYEDMDACHLRAAKVADKLRQMAEISTNERIALISHGTFLEALISALLGVSGHRSYFSHYNTAIDRIDFMADGFLVIRYTNRIAHIPSAMISR